MGPPLLLKLSERRQSVLTCRSTDALIISVCFISPTPEERVERHLRKHLHEHTRAMRSDAVEKTPMHTERYKITSGIKKQR